MLLFLGDVKKLPVDAQERFEILYLLSLKIWLRFLCYIQTIDTEVDKSWHKVANAEILFLFYEVARWNAHLYIRDKKRPATYIYMKVCER